MKLRNRIMLGTFACLLLALTVSCVLMTVVNRNNMINNSRQFTEAELKKLVDGISVEEVKITGLKTELTADSAMKYIFSKMMTYADTDTNYDLQSGDRIIFNSSGVNASAILELEHGKTDKEIYSDIISRIGHSYLLAGRNVWIGGYCYQVCIVRDITKMIHQVRHLIVVCIAIGLGVSFLASVALFLFLKLAFQPLEQLKNEADAISQGEFQRRIVIKGKDELADLSRSFNTMAESIQQSISEALETSEARKRMNHALAHEMRTPVTAISGYAYAIRSMKMSNEQKEEALEFVDLEARRLERLSRKLTVLVGLDTYEMELKRIDLDYLKKYLQMIWKEREDISLQIEQGEIIGDADLLLMLITNLCDNAKKAQANKIEVRITPKGIWVKDDGRGISSQEREKIFEAFYQGDTSRNQEGFGLGLSLCQAIARLHNTELCVESEQGKGSTFFLYNSFTTL